MITEAMTPDDFMNTVIPWAAGVFVVVWVVIFFVKILKSAWKDDDE